MHMVAVGGSDAGISAALRAREVEPGAEVTVVVVDSYPNFSICGIPYYVSGEVADWHALAHRSLADRQDTGMRLHSGPRAPSPDTGRHRVHVSTADDEEALDTTP